MKSRAGSCARVLCVSLAVLATIEARSQSLPTSATIDAVPLELTMPERFQIVSTLEPIRRVLIVAPADGLIRSLDAGLGSTVRETQQVAELDRAEAGAKLKIAQAELKEKQAQVAIHQIPDAVGLAQVEAAEARAELARIELDRLTLRSPFAGRIVAVPVTSGQFVLKGTVIAELADVTALKSLVPVDRRVAKAGGDLLVQIEDQDLTAKIQSIGPLPTTDEYKPLRELAAPFATAWVQVANPKGELEPGFRVRSSSLPVTAIATIPKGAVKPVTAGAEPSQVQVIRNEYVTNVPVKVLGKVGPDRLQVAGAFRASDGLIASSSSPLLAGTLVRFGQGGAGVEGTTPDPARRGQNA
ncbi:MAG: HlyD family efflux transporter periplasmic adaptor subunit, partial [Paludisphaera borealis]|uniref:efflux RND transporter periplasmic adaptor subunit n=1 Tax=Paludisphaera borealis TaxID=1387353 RepID=UPI00284C22D2